MPRTISQEQLTERFRKIPRELRTAMSSIATADKLFEIGKRHELLVDKTGELAAETGFLMLGITHPNEFISNLANRLEIDREKAKAIADDINREVFAPVREHLRGMFGSPTIEDKSDQPATNKQILQRKSEQEHVSSAMNNENQEQKSDSPIIGDDKMVSSGQQKTTLDDLEAELEKALAEEQDTLPLSVVEKNTKSMAPVKMPSAIYKGVDPYREPVGENLPNINAKPYAHAPAEQELDSGIVNHEKEEKEEKIINNNETGSMNEKKNLENGKLPAFQGFNMNNAQKEQQVSEKKDMYREPIE